LNKVTIFAMMVVTALSLSISMSAFPSPGHPGGFYADIVATGYGVKLLNVDGESHVSPDKLSAITKLVGDTRDLYAVNYTLETKGMNIIIVSAPAGVEVEFKPRKVWKAEILLSDGFDPAMSTEAQVKYIVSGIPVYDHENFSNVENFNVHAYSSGDYGYTNPTWIHYPDPPNPSNPLDKAESYSTFEKSLIDNETYVGWRINISSYERYVNTTNSHELNATAIMNATILVNKNGKEVILYARANVRVYSPNSGSDEKEAKIKIVVNTSGTYAWRNGVLKYTNTSTTIKVKDIPGIWDGSPGIIANLYKNHSLTAQATVEFGDITLSVEEVDEIKIEHIRPGVWAFNSNGNVNLTMLIYPHPIASGYKQIFVQFTRQ